MGDFSHLINFLNDQNEERLRNNFLKAKGYEDPLSKNFGLNQWTERLQIDATDQKTSHLVSFLTIPSHLQDELIDIRSEELHKWISRYQWIRLPDVDSSFSNGELIACSDGLIWPSALTSTNLQQMDKFLIIYHSGVCEYGLGKEAVYIYEEEVYFDLIRIIGRLWQFLLFSKEFYQNYVFDNIPHYLCYVNIRGTQNALLGGLANGWNQPFGDPFRAYKPRCADIHLQIIKKVPVGISQEQIENIVRWFATRIDNAWGQFEPRCYVNKNRDSTLVYSSFCKI